MHVLCHNFTFHALQEMEAELEQRRSYAEDPSHTVDRLRELERILSEKSEQLVTQSEKNYVVCCLVNVFVIVRQRVVLIWGRDAHAACRQHSCLEYRRDQKVSVP